MIFSHAAILMGLVALVIPILIHFWNRRRYRIVDWGAMQFLRLDARKRRRLFWDDLFLLLLRVLVVLLLVLAIAGPRFRSTTTMLGQDVPPRDIVIILDGSMSMQRRFGTESIQDACRNWLQGFLKQLSSADRLALIQARQQPRLMLSRFTEDREVFGQALLAVQPTRGTCSLPSAVQEALPLLRSRPHPHIVILGDGQWFGLADPISLERWSFLASGKETVPPIHLVNVVADKTPPINWSIEPIQGNRTVLPVDREVLLRTHLRVSGSGEKSVPKVRLEIDGRPFGEVKPSATLDGERWPLSVKHSLATPGSHVVTLSIEEDSLPGDNRQDWAVDVVPAIPILLVDGDIQRTVSLRGVDYLQSALAPSLDSQPAFAVAIVPAPDFTANTLRSMMPRGLVLSNIERLNPEQQQAVDRFLQDGHGVLILLGNRTSAEFFNQVLSNPSSWFPAKLLEIQSPTTSLDQAERLLISSLQHPTLDSFRQSDASLGQAYFPRYWKLDVPRDPSITVLARLTNQAPLFVEKRLPTGKLLLSAVPFDRSWRSNLTDLGDFVRLCHEWMYYLADQPTLGSNLRPGQAVRIPMIANQPQSFQVQLPDGSLRKMPHSNPPVFFTETNEVGLYRIQMESGKQSTFVIPPDPQESDWRPITQAEQQQIQSRIPNVHWSQTPQEVLQQDASNLVTYPVDHWFWWFVMGLLFLELAFLRRG